MFTIQHPYVFAFGIIGNIISFMVFLAPLPTFVRVYKKKSTEGFQSFPYVIAIFSAMLWIYYALLKGNAVLLITVNVAGVIIETIYVAIYITYAPRQARISTLKTLMFMNFGGFCSIVLLCHYLTKGQTRLQVFGWICVAFSVSVFAAPLSVMRTVIRTKSVEYMPINLSVCLTLTATIWFFYGFAQRDLYLTLPNVVGLVFGVAQMTLYFVFKRYENKGAAAQKPKQLPEVATPVKQDTLIELHTITSSPPPHNPEDDIPPRHHHEIQVILPNKDDIHHHHDHDHHDDHDDHDVVVVVEEVGDHNNNNNNNHEKIQHDSFYGPIQGPASCYVESEKIVGGPGPASTYASTYKNLMCKFSF